MEDIVTIFENKIHFDVFHDWYWHSVENEIDQRKINLWHYAQMIWSGKTHEEIIEDMDKEQARRQTAEYKAESETQLRRLYYE